MEGHEEFLRVPIINIFVSCKTLSYILYLNHWVYSMVCVLSVCMLYFNNMFSFKKHLHFKGAA